MRTEGQGAFALDVPTRFEAVFDDSETYRYILRGPTGFVCPDEIEAVILWIMLNPSTATELVADRTVNRVIAFSWRWGYTTWIVANLYAYRTPYPKELFRVAPELRIGPENDRHIRTALTEARRCVVAWGAGAEEERADEVLAMVRQAGLPPLALSVTESGQPGHPLYLHADTSLRDLETASPLPPSDREYLGAQA
jgi:hypothetical protein